MTLSKPQGPCMVLVRVHHMSCLTTLKASSVHHPAGLRSRVCWRQAWGIMAEGGMDTEPRPAKGLEGLCASTSSLCLTRAHQSLAWAVHDATARPLTGMGSALCGQATGLQVAPIAFVLPTTPSRAFGMGELLQLFAGKITLIILSAAFLAFVTVWCPGASFVLKALFIFNKSSSKQRLCSSCHERQHPREWGTGSAQLHAPPACAATRAKEEPSGTVCLPAAAVPGAAAPGFFFQYAGALLPYTCYFLNV